MTNKKSVLTLIAAGLIGGSVAQKAFAQGAGEEAKTEAPAKKKGDHKCGKKHGKKHGEKKCGAAGKDAKCGGKKDEAPKAEAAPAAPEAPAKQ